MNLRWPVLLAGTACAATCGVITACGSPGPMSQAEAQRTYSSIVVQLKRDLTGMVQAGQDNNFALMRQKALAAKNEIDALPRKLRQYNWPNGTDKWDAANIHLVQTKAPVMSRCLGSLGQASDLLEMEAAIQGSACQQLQSLGQLPVSLLTRREGAGRVAGGSPEFHARAETGAVTIRDQSLWRKETMSDQYETVFARYDTNGDGRLAVDEVTAAIAGMFPPDEVNDLSGVVSALFEHYDTDHDGLLSVAEFVPLAENLPELDSKN